MADAKIQEGSRDDIPNVGILKQSEEELNLLKISMVFFRVNWWR